MRPFRIPVGTVILFVLLGTTLPAPAVSFAFATIEVPGATNSYATGINNAGQIVGSFEDTRGKKHGYVRSAHGAFTTFDVPGATKTYASGINSSGQIVGAFADGNGHQNGYVTTR